VRVLQCVKFLVKKGFQEQKKTQRLIQLDNPFCFFLLPKAEIQAVFAGKNQDNSTENNSAVSFQKQPLKEIICSFGDPKMIISMYF
jgi:hypothetical protein